MRRSGRIAVAIGLLVAPGLAVAGICGWYALQDWSALQIAYRHFHGLAASGADMRALYIAEQAQSIHRLNLFAEGVWTLLGAVLAGVGLHAILVMPREKDSPGGATEGGQIHGR